MERVAGRAAASRPTRAAAIALLLGLVVVAAAAWPSPAAASCAGEEGFRSPWRFTGVVTAVRSEQRIATVLTDDGRTVEVRGGSPRAMSSVDRTYRPGGRYEFHPVDDSSPFEDNACTATRLLSVGAVPPAEPASPAPASPGRPPETGALLAVASAGLLALAAAVARWRSRHRSPRPTGHRPG